MTTTTYRQGCGTHIGMLLHQAADETPCGECQRGEQLRRLSAEEFPSPMRHQFGPISKEQAARNLAALTAAMADDEPSNPSPPDPTPHKGA